MSSAPDVSVVIPTRNRPELAVRAAGSALAQTHEAIEVVVVIDGPDPETRANLETVGDERLRVIELPEPGKAPNARNVGTRNARGRWTALLDDDDEWLPTKVERQLTLAATASRASPVVATPMISRPPRADTVMPRRLP